MTDPSPPHPTSAGEISLGRELRRAREVRGISLEQIAQETKISERYLHALEADRLDLLPGALYARNFVRQYAQFIGADEEELLDYFTYQQRLHDEAVARGGRAASETARRRALALAGLGIAALVIVAVLVMSLVAKDDGAGDEPSGTAKPRVEAVPQPKSAPSTTAAANPTSGGSQVAPAPPLPVLSASAPKPSEPAPVTASPPTAAAPAPATADAEKPAPAANACPEVPVAKLVFNEESWVEIRRDGATEPDFGLKKRGTVLEYPVEPPLSISVGNAANVALFLDGQAAKPLGADGESRKITLTCRNFRSYL